MSLQIEPQKLDNLFANMQSLLESYRKRELTERADDNSYGTARALEDLGLLQMAKGDYETARASFKEATEYYIKYLDVRNLKRSINPKHEYPALTGLGITILSLDKNLIAKFVDKLDFSIPINEWSRATQAAYCLTQAEAGLALNWDQERMEQLRLASKNMRKDIQAWFHILWAILDNDLDKLKENFTHLINSERRVHKGRPISAQVTYLLILAQMKKLDLKDFDPPMASMDYIKLLK